MTRLRETSVKGDELGLVAVDHADGTTTYVVFYVGPVAMLKKSFDNRRKAERFYTQQLISLADLNIGPWRN